MSSDYKLCPKCQQEKPLSAFSIDNSKKQKHRVHCKVCCSEYAKKHRKYGPQGKAKSSFISTTEKTCSKCGQTKPLSDFRQRSGKRAGRYYAQCKKCLALINLAWARNNSEKKRAQRAQQNLKKNSVRHAHHKKQQSRDLNKSHLHQPYATGRRLKIYGLTLDEYNAILERQNGVCAICGQPETAKDQKGRIRVLAIDHDHTTGKVRGLLCFRCNTDIGRFENRFADFQSYLSQQQPGALIVSDRKSDQSPGAAAQP